MGHDPLPWDLVRLVVNRQRAEWDKPPLAGGELPTIDESYYALSVLNRREDREGAIQQWREENPCLVNAKVLSSKKPPNPPPPRRRPKSLAP